MNYIEEILINSKEEIFQKYPLTQLGIFGSSIREDYEPESDIDILIEYNRKRKFSILDLISLKEYLSKLLNKDVDIAIKSRLKSAIGIEILKEVRFI